jgi:hypothetical protein
VWALCVWQPCGVVTESPSLMLLAGIVGVTATWLLLQGLEVVQAVSLPGAPGVCKGCRHSTGISRHVPQANTHLHHRKNLCRNVGAPKF